MEMATASATDNSGLFVYPTQSRESPFKAKVFEFVCVGGRSFIFNNYLITNPPLLKSIKIIICQYLLRL